MLTEMFDVEQRTTGVNIGRQLSNTLGGGLAPLIATASASIRPDTHDAGRLHEKGAH